MSLLRDLADLVLPGSCAGCGAEREPLRDGACAACVAEVEGLRPYAASPESPPPGMPRCVAAGAYEGAVRGMLLAYKERGRHGLARPLGAVLAAAVAEVAPDRSRPLLIVPVPSTAAAQRERLGDHMARLATRTVRRLRAAGWDAAVARPLRAAPRPDSASLDASARRVAAESSLRIRPTRIGVPTRRTTMRSTLVVVDDIVTTGATLAAVTARLEEANMQVAGAAVVAATRLRRALPHPSPARPARTGVWTSRHAGGSANEG
ncbi:phosphoribosyltransferase family protein [Actinoplanes sp. NPDC051470]|uniref:ComF family protein n=1 Tax=Actinoplanes sp. NPDC051470 TaxID=3157224 RepID=UPI00341DA444